MLDITVTSLSIASIIVICFTAGRVLRNQKNTNSKQDFVIFLLLLMASSVNIFMIAKPIILLIQPSLSFDSLLVIYGVTASFSYMALSHFIKIIFSTADRMEAGFHYWKHWIIIMVAFLLVLAMHIVLNLNPLVIDVGFLNFKTFYIPNVLFSTFVLIGAELTFLPFLVKFYQMNKKNQSKRGARTGNLILCYFELLGFSVLYPSAYGMNQATIIIGYILVLGINLLLMYIFLKPNTIEAMLMQLNIESIYLLDGSGNTLYYNVFIPGKNVDAHDTLVGFLVKGTYDALSMIVSATNQGLKRIELEDGTAIIVEKDELNDFFYVVFTRRYSKYTHDKVYKFINVLGYQIPNFLEHKFQKNSQVIGKLISSIFLES
ncbi:MAG: hypothetical protein ACFFCS_20855 [Candidatus Hodarchaeota archaeon]